MQELEDPSRLCDNKISKNLIEDDPRLSDSDRDSDSHSGCFSDAEDTQTDYSSGSGCDEDTKAGADSDISDKEDSDDDGKWLQNEEEDHPPEYYLQLEASLDPQTRFKAINAITSYCEVQEGSLSQYRDPDTTNETIQGLEYTRPSIYRPQVPTIEEAIRSVLIKNSEEPKKNKRPTMCFLCLQNEKLKLHERVHSYHGASITKHFERKHLKDFKKLDCNICKVTLGTLKNLLIHAEIVHGTVTRNPKYLQLM
ncbi:hypothetical protein ACJ73_01408 [Blastomyces percursus]|uniref:C2H2-type domain-containing protein n=1 Tax=Blastomyces percursus TaxID=1658174 RepID=A0A1J9R4A6_9EURO|nr:hypothetical protein ACJ73_01408 [Blastomyces percursus]